MYKKLVIGNWKMNPVSVKDAEKIFRSIAKNQKFYKNVEVAVCVPNLFLPILGKKNSARLALGAQNSYFEESGAFTGEVSAKMLKNFKVKYCIVGHSERRAMGDTNATCAMKINALLKVGITPILCVGENNRTNDHKYLDFVRRQIVESFAGVPKNSFPKIVIAYEPIWAIGINAIREATPAECREMILFIKKTISTITDIKTAHNMRVLYGGSVNKKNAPLFVQEGEPDGFLVGRDSLHADDFLKIINSASSK